MARGGDHGRHVHRQNARRIEGYVRKVGNSPTNRVRQWVTHSSWRINLNSLSEQITVNTASQVHTTLPQMGWQSTLSKPKAGFASIKEGKEIPLTSRIQFLNTVRERSTLNTGYHASSDDDKKGPTMSTTLAQA